MPRLLILLGLSPFHHVGVDRALELADAARRLGREVDVFLMMDGVYCAFAGQSGEPFKVEAVYERLARLMEAGSRVVACRVCMELRGLSGENTVGGMEIGGLYDLSESVGEADTVLTFTEA